MGQIPKLTYGVELEFLVAMQKPDPPTHVKQLETALPICGDEEASRKVVDLLGSHDIPTIYDCDMWGSNEVLTRLAKGYNLELAPDLEIHHQFWQVKRDPSVYMPGIDARSRLYNWLSVELTSPVYDDWQKFEEDVNKVCDILRRNLVCVMNETTGCHVHISERQLNGVSLTTAKKTLGLYTIMEPMLLKLCAPHRAESVWCQPITRKSPLHYYMHPKTFSGEEPDDLAECLPDDIASNCRRLLFAILEQKDFASLAQLISRYDNSSSDPRLAFKVSTTYAEKLANLIGSEPDWDEAPAPRWKRTMEARSLQGTLNPDLILQWTKLLLIIVRAAQQETDIYKLVLGRLARHTRLFREDRPYNLADFLEDFQPVLDPSFPVDQSLRFWAGILRSYC